jgi:hypothetical protein
VSPLSLHFRCRGRLQAAFNAEKHTLRRAELPEPGQIPRLKSGYRDECKLQARVVAILQGRRLRGGPDWGADILNKTKAEATREGGLSLFVA